MNSTKLLPLWLTAFAIALPSQLSAVAKTNLIHVNAAKSYTAQSIASAFRGPDRSIYFAMDGDG